MSSIPASCCERSVTTLNPAAAEVVSTQSPKTNNKETKRNRERLAIGPVELIVVPAGTDFQDAKHLGEHVMGEAEGDNCSEPRFVGITNALTDVVVEVQWWRPTP